MYIVVIVPNLMIFLKHMKDLLGEERSQKDAVLVGLGTK
jgi:hypothetical protein